MTRPAETNFSSGSGDGHISRSVRFLAAVLLVAISCAEQPQRDASVTLLPQGVKADFSVVTGSAGTAMVDFFSSTCGQCGFMDSAVVRVARRFEGRALVAKADVSEEYVLARRWGITSLPTFVFYRDGRETRRLVGPASEDSLCGIIDGLLAGSR
jgi:thioredoxin 1